MVEISIQIKNLPQIRNAFAQAPAHMTKNLTTAIRKTVLFVESKSQQKVPVKDGGLKGSIYRSFAPLRGEVGYRISYAEAVHEGSKPHTIVPINKKALWWKGAKHPVKRVDHPGQRPNPFLRKAVDDNQGQIDKFFTEAVQKTLNDAARGAR